MARQVIPMSQRRHERIGEMGLQSTLRHVGAMAAALSDAGAAVCALSSRLREEDLDDIVKEESGAEDAAT